MTFSAGTLSAGQAALVLVGHGSSRHADAALPVRALAEGIRARGGFSEVAAAFLKNAPDVGQALDLVRAAVVVVVPVFAGRGYYTDTVIPRALGLDGAVTRRGDRTIFYTAPVGENPRLADLLAGRAEAVAACAGFEPAETTLLLIAHGSSRPGGAGKTPRAIAASLAARRRFAEVALVFLEQPPKATEWPAMVSHRDVVALPLLVAPGMHAGEDIPVLFGDGAAAGATVSVHGHRVRLAGSLGVEPELADIVEAMARSALVGAPG